MTPRLHMSQTCEHVHVDSLALQPAQASATSVAGLCRLLRLPRPNMARRNTKPEGKVCRISNTKVRTCPKAHALCRYSKKKASERILRARPSEAAAFADSKKSPINKVQPAAFSIDLCVVLAEHFRSHVLERAAAHLRFLLFSKNWRF